MSQDIELPAWLERELRDQGVIPLPEPKPQSCLPAPRTYEFRPYNGDF